MEQMKASDWKQGWIGGANGYAGLPQNVSGRNSVRPKLPSYNSTPILPRDMRCLSI